MDTILTTNKYAVLPAQVRYDRALSPTSILLFAEIVAASNAYGICEEDNGYFASVLRISSRSVTRCLSQLIDNRHLERVRDKNGLKLHVLSKNIPLPEDTQVQIVDKAKEDITPFLEQIFHIWDKNLGVKTERVDMYEDMVRDRLLAFSREDLLLAVKNRISFVRESDWHNKEENRLHAANIEHVLGADKTVLKYLTYKQTTQSQQLRPFKKL